MQAIQWICKYLPPQKLELALRNQKYQSSPLHSHVHPSKQVMVVPYWQFSEMTKFVLLFKINAKMFSWTLSVGYSRYISLTSSKLEHSYGKNEPSLQLTSVLADNDNTDEDWIVLLYVFCRSSSNKPQSEPLEAETRANKNSMSKHSPPENKIQTISTFDDKSNQCQINI